MIKPVNLEALSKWIHAIPEDVKRDVTVVAPMLEKLGYDPYAYPPKYGDPDQFVADNTLHIKNNEDFWRKKGQEVLYQNAKLAKASSSLGEKKGGGAAAQIYKDNDNNKENAGGVQTDNGDGEDNKLRW